MVNRLFNRGMNLVSEKYFYHSLLFSVETIVFGLLATLLLFYYRGLGRQYVKYWMLSLFALSIHQCSLAIDTLMVEVSVTAIEKIILTCVIQLSLYVHLVTLLFGIYCATRINTSLNTLLIMFLYFVAYLA